MRKSFLNVTKIVLLGKAPGVPFKLDCAEDGTPRDAFWAKRLRAGEIATVPAEPAPAAPPPEKVAPKRKAD